jgi:hypothetical protein
MARKQTSTSLEENLLKELKIHCAKESTTINETIENALKLWLALQTEQKGLIASYLPLDKNVSTEIIEYLTK